MPKDQEELEHEVKTRYYQMKWEFRWLVLSALYILVAHAYNEITPKSRLREIADAYAERHKAFMSTHFSEKPYDT